MLEWLKQTSLACPTTSAPWPTFDTGHQPFATPCANMGTVRNLHQSVDSCIIFWYLNIASHWLAFKKLCANRLGRWHTHEQKKGPARCGGLRPATTARLSVPYIKPKTDVRAKDHASSSGAPASGIKALTHACIFGLSFMLRYRWGQACTHKHFTALFTSSLPAKTLVL